MYFLTPNIQYISMPALQICDHGGLFWFIHFVNLSVENYDIYSSSPYRIIVWNHLNNYSSDMVKLESNEDV